jgi:hypothetical protein
MEEKNGNQKDGTTSGDGASGEQKNGTGVNNGEKNASETVPQSSGEKNVEKNFKARKRQAKAIEVAEIHAAVDSIYNDEEKKACAAIQAHYKIRQAKSTLQILLRQRILAHE